MVRLLQSATVATNTSATSSAAPSATAVAGDSFKGTPPLVISGYRFFDSSTGKYFGIRGANYYPRPNAGAFDANNLDFFSRMSTRASATGTSRMDPDVDHTDFMCELQAEGIYVMADLGSSCPGCEIAPASSPVLPGILQDARGGNEVNHRSADKTPPNFNAPCQKTFVRGMRNYIASCPSMRQIPVGLVVADHEREENALYYNCVTEKTGVEKDPLEQAQ
ncbi:Glycoside hydrolase, partial [Globisporangium splendens]